MVFHPPWKKDFILYASPRADILPQDFHPTVEVHFWEQFSMPLVIRASLRESNTSREAKADWIRIEVDEITSYNEDDPRSLIEGRMMGTGEQMKLLYEAYFRQHIRSW